MSATGDNKRTKEENEAYTEWWAESLGLEPVMGIEFDIEQKISQEIETKNKKVKLTGVVKPGLDAILTLEIHDAEGDSRSTIQICLSDLARMVNAFEELKR